MLNLRISEPFKTWLAPARFKIAYGGRNSSKSHSIATLLLVIAVNNPLRILCLREYQKNLKESVKQLLEDKINQSSHLRSFYTVYYDRIIGINGTQFVFEGIKNAKNIKSFEGANIAWLEEAQAISKSSLEILIPTIRKENSEIWISFNPESIDDPVYQFILKPRKNQITLKMNYLDNPFCPLVMIEEANILKKNDYTSYEHIWLGEPLVISDRIIFKDKWEVLDFQINERNNTFNNEYINFRYGIDFGFSDPCAIIETFAHGENLYINNEIYLSKMQTDDITIMMVKHMPRCFNTVIYADDNRPDTISNLNIPRRAYTGDFLPALYVIKADKKKGSVKSGIAWLKNKNKIYIHPRCSNTISCFKRYMYKINQKTGIISDEVCHDFSHIPDALRYAYSDLISSDDIYNPFANPDLHLNV